MRCQVYCTVATTTFSPCSFLASHTRDGPIRVSDWAAAHPTCGPTPGTREKEKMVFPALYQTSAVLSPITHHSRLFSSCVMVLSVDESLSEKKSPGNNN